VRLGNPSEPRSSPYTAELLAPDASRPAPDRPASRTGASPEPPRSTLDPDRGYYGETRVGFRWGHLWTGGRGRYSTQAPGMLPERRRRSRASATPKTMQRYGQSAKRLDINRFRL
jgi:hypothetical protein